MDAVEVDGLRIAYEQAGSEPPAPGAPRTLRSRSASPATQTPWPASLHALDLGTPHVAGLSFGGVLAIELAHRHPAVARSLVLGSAYAGWRGSLSPSAAEARLAQALELSRLSSDEFADTLLPTMFSEGTPQATVDDFGASVRSFHPSGFRAMANASAEDLRDALPHVEAPTLLICGENDVRAPMAVARHLEESIPGARLVVLPGAGHVCNLEAPERSTRRCGSSFAKSEAPQS